MHNNDVKSWKVRQTHLEAIRTVSTSLRETGSQYSIAAFIAENEIGNSEKRFIEDVKPWVGKKAVFKQFINATIL